MEYTMDELVSIARSQKAVFWCIVAELMCLLFPPAVLLVEPFQMYFVDRLGSALRIPGLLFWVAAMLIPVVSLILLVILWQSARKALESNGVRVGLFGADIGEIQARLAQNQSPPTGQ
ncbi:MAG: hypothetical protein WC655_06610 [Candidatus Hydrogenedentales bacterium]